MNFDKNLVVLRNRANLSQEALADKLNVSRQTIYKWETGQTYPDTDKLCEIAQIFAVSVDTLLNELEEEQEYSKEEVVKHFRTFGILIGVPVLMIFIGVALMLVLTTLLNFPNNTIIGIVVMLAIIFIAVIIIVVGALNFENFKKENITVEFSKKEVRKARNSFTLFLVMGISFIFLGVVVMICFGLIEELALLSVPILLVLIGIGVMVITISSIVYELYENPQVALLSDDQKPHRKEDKIPAIIMIVSTIVFFVLGFTMELWKYSWIAFVVGGLLCGISGIVFHDEKK